MSLWQLKWTRQGNTVKLNAAMARNVDVRMWLKAAEPNRPLRAARLKAFPRSIRVNCSRAIEISACA